MLCASSNRNKAAEATAIAALIIPETKPLREPAKATMPINSGAGSGTVMKKRSTAMAINAVAIVRAGPEMARQSSCIFVLVVCENNRRSLT